MANAEDLNRLTSCSLVLLGHIFLSLGNARESMNMVTPAMQLASKIPDVHVQLWAAAILKGNTKSKIVASDQSQQTGYFLDCCTTTDLYRLSDPAREQEGLQMHANFSQMLLKDHFHASQLPEHGLIQWTDGRFPAMPEKPAAAATEAEASTSSGSSQQHFN